MKNQSQILTRLGLTKGKISDCIQIVEMHRDILLQQGLHPAQVAKRKNLQLTAKYNKLGYDMLAHYNIRKSEHNKKIVNDNMVLLDTLEQESLGGEHELPSAGKYNKYKQPIRKNNGTKKHHSQDEKDTISVRRNNEYDEGH